MARLDRLPQLKEVAQFAACIGREFDERLLGSICGLGEGPLREALAGLLDAELVFRRGSADEGRLAFKHALVRDAAYESLLKVKRQEIHVRLVAALEARPGTPPELLAHHATQAGLTAKAIDYWQQAGAQAMTRPAYKEAMAHLAQATRLAEEMGDAPPWPERRLVLQMAMGQASIPLRGYSHSQTVAIFTRARELAATLGDPAHRLSISYAMWVAHYVRGEQDEALDTARGMLERAEQERNDGHQLTALRALGISQMITGAPTLARDTFDGAAKLAEALRQRSRQQRLAVAYRFAADPEIATQFHVCLTSWALGKVRDASEIAAQAVSAARAMGHAHTLGHALAHGAIYAVVCGRADEALALSAECVAFANRHDMELWRGYGLVLNAYAHALKGDAAHSASVMEGGLASMARTHTGAMLPMHYARHACTLAALGRHDEAARFASLTEQELRSGSERYFWPECRRLLGDYARACAGASRAQIEAAYSEALSLARGQHAKSWALCAATSLARLWAENGERGKALDLLSPLHAGFADSGEWPAYREAGALLEILR
jgi:predicted ATPase